MSNMEQVLSAVQARPYSMRTASLESLQAIWSGLNSTLVATLRSGKGMSIGNFGTWSFHVDPVDLGTQKKMLRTPVFELSEKFSRLYNLRCPKQPSGISGQIPVRGLNVLAIANAAGQPRELVGMALKDIFTYVGEMAMSGQTIRLDFKGVGYWLCSGGQCRFHFGPTFAGTFESLERPRTSHGVAPPTPSIFALVRPRSSQMGSLHDVAPPTPPRPASRPSPALQSRPSSRPLNGSSLGATQEISIQGQDLTAPIAVGRALPTPPPSRGAAQKEQLNDDAQMFVLHDEGLDVKQIEITVRGRELVVRQRNIGMERVYPLHSRVETEKISAKYKKGRLEIRIPDKASAMRAFYAKQMEERGKAQVIEEEEDAALAKIQAKKAAMALELEKQALVARRKARAEVEAYNRKLLNFKKKDPFPTPDSCGYLLYNRQEVDAKMTRLEPHVLRSVLDTQVSMKKEVEERQKAAERALIETEVQRLQEMLESDQRKAMEEKRDNIKKRQRELAGQIAQMPPRLPGAFSATCDFPRMDNDLQAQARQKEDLKLLQEQVLGMVHEKGQATLQQKRSQYKADMMELAEIQKTLDQETQDKFMSDQSTKIQNRKTWTDQIQQKRQQVCNEMTEDVYATSLPIGEAETMLVRTIKPQPAAA
jgi:hypothetical protein